ncbi:MAG: NAD(P)H-dependent oxidoreductase subunit E [Clostridiales bacterium]|nr:NAD(P)H-dependent oxidoreductase subunit E [Clostridiales bacterium]
MSKIKLTTVAFKGTAEQETQLRQVLDDIKSSAHPSVMTALQRAQAIYGYLPIEVQSIIADEMGVSLEEVFGVATFYSQFTLNPQGSYAFGVCLGTACYVKGSGDVVAKLEECLGLKDGETSSDGKYSIASTRCVGCCGLAPVMTVNNEVYGKLTVKDIPDIVAKYKAM